MVEWILVSDLFRNAGRLVANRLQLIRRGKLDYVLLPVSGSYPERFCPTRRRFPVSLLPWPTAPASVEVFAANLDRLAADPRLKGVVLLISGLTAEPATLTSLRDTILRFRQSGKRAVAFLSDITMWSYYLATACDQVLAPESAVFRAAGLWSETVFLKDTLALAGIRADFEAIAEYKVSPDVWRRSKMTGPHREMLESILDSVYDHVVERIAEGRGLSAKKVRKLLDSVPLTAAQARQDNLLDDICYEDELPTKLGAPAAPAAVLPWEQAGRWLIRPIRWHSRRAIGVISVEGLIVSGPSRRPPLPLPLPLPTTQAGSDTIVQQLRAAARDKHLAAVVLHVDSPGGSALAADLIWREVRNLARTKPVVAYMGNRAASGGYYITAPAQSILAEPLTLTGSIGIWSGKFVTRELYQRADAVREVVSRGKAAGLYADAAPFSDDERARIRADLGQGYARFKARVAEGRHKSDDEVEAVGRGRVWTGSQAVEQGLVDELGDLCAAAAAAKELAGMDPRRHTISINVQAPRKHQLAQALPGTPNDWLRGLLGLLGEGLWALAPWDIRIRG